MAAKYILPLKEALCCRSVRPGDGLTLARRASPLTPGEQRKIRKFVFRKIGIIQRDFGGSSRAQENLRFRARVSSCVDADYTPVRLKSLDAGICLQWKPWDDGFTRFNMWHNDFSQIGKRQRAILGPLFLRHALMNSLPPLNPPATQHTQPIRRIKHTSLPWRDADLVRPQFYHRPFAMRKHRRLNRGAG